MDNSWLFPTFQGVIIQQVSHLLFGHPEAAAEVVLQLLAILIHEALLEGFPLLVEFHEQVPLRLSPDVTRSSTRELFPLERIHEFFHSEKPSSVLVPSS